MKDSLRPSLPRAVLLPLSLLALSCGGGGTLPPQKDPPQATLSVPKPNTAGQKLTVMVSATGCDQIQSLSVYDRDDFLKTVAYAGTGQVPVDLAINEIKYTRGIAAQLSLRAHVVCTDGRQNDSQPQAATFFPAAEVVSAPTNSQLLPDYFVTDGALPLINFLGCGNDPTQGNASFLYLLNTNGGVLQSLRMPFPCTAATIITPKHPTTGKRWVWTPNAGAISIDSNLKVSASSLASSPLDMLTVGPDGDAVIYDTGVGVERIDHQTGAVKWRYIPLGSAIIPPNPRGDDVVVASVTTTGAPTGQSNIIVARVDYGRQNPNTGGVELGTTILGQLASDDITAANAPPSAFSPDGNLLYLALPVGSTTYTNILACPTQTPGCNGSHQRWSEPVGLNASIVALVPYAAGSRVAAIARQQAWFLDGSNGSILNKNSEPLSTNSGLVVLQVQSGAPPFPQAFYLLTGAAPQENLPPPQPLEIIATDDPAKGELYRYQVNAGSLSVAMDDSGTLWMRAVGDVVRPLTPAQYRQVKP